MKKEPGKNDFTFLLGSFCLGLEGLCHMAVLSVIRSPLTVRHIP